MHNLIRHLIKIFARIHAILFGRFNHTCEHTFLLIIYSQREKIEGNSVLAL